jgi:hypothetical protein
MHSTSPLPRSSISGALEPRGNAIHLPPLPKSTPLKPDAAGSISKPATIHLPCAKLGLISRSTSAPSPKAGPWTRSRSTSNPKASQISSSKSAVKSSRAANGVSASKRPPHRPAKLLKLFSSKTSLLPPAGVSPKLHCRRQAALPHPRSTHRSSHRAQTRLGERHSFIRCPSRRLRHRPARSWSRTRTPNRPKTRPARRLVRAWKMTLHAKTTLL